MINSSVSRTNEDRPPLIPLKFNDPKIEIARAKPKKIRFMLQSQEKFKSLDQQNELSLLDQATVTHSAQS